MMENSSDDEMESDSSSRRTSSVEPPDHSRDDVYRHRSSLEADRVPSPATVGSEQEDGGEESSQESDLDTPHFAVPDSYHREDDSVAPPTAEMLLADSIPTAAPLDESAIPLLEVTETVDLLKAKSLQEEDSRLAASGASSDSSTSKWQDWFQFTTEQLAKNVKERSTRAYDAISAITSSGSIRKRKRNSVTKQSTAGEKSTTAAATTTGIGTLHVELISAYKVTATPFTTHPHPASP
jgi:hypothetical protein